VNRLARQAHPQSEVRPLPSSINQAISLRPSFQKPGSTFYG